MDIEQKRIDTINKKLNTETEMARQMGMQLTDGQKAQQENEKLKKRIELLEAKLEQRSETRQHETIVMWNFTKIEVPKSGDYVWVCNARDKNSKLIKWGTGDEAFYSYWMPADRPKPPQAT